MKVDFEVLTDVRKGEMFAITLNDTFVCLESLGGKKPNKHQVSILYRCELFPKLMLGLRAGPQNISRPDSGHGLPKGNSKWDKS